ncbi:MAG: 4Fe-4S dicluster domain-containing protein [Ilumatobacteraceae bacterium]
MLRAPSGAGMVVRTDTERSAPQPADGARVPRLVDRSFVANVGRWNEKYGVDTEHFGSERATKAQPVVRDNELYVRDYEKCILCYKCVGACGSQWQNTFAIAVAGRGFDARIAAEYDAELPDSACVYCGNCIAVCPTGALMFTTEHDMRAAGNWDESRQTQTDTICPYCGVGCQLTLHVQDASIVKVTSPSDHSVTHGNLCIKGRFGFSTYRTATDPALARCRGRRSASGRSRRPG